MNRFKQSFKCVAYLCASLALLAVDSLAAESVSDQGLTLTEAITASNITASAGVTHPDARADQTQEVLVTAQKRTERLKDVPISISVLGTNQLEEASTAGVTDVLNQVPGVFAIPGYQGGGTQISIRGVGAAGPLFTGSSPIAYYLDSVPFGLIKSAIAPDSDAYDLERVEVLRGPQGTLYGAGGENGVVRVLTNDAKLEKFDFKFRTTASYTDGGSGNYRGDTELNLPIIEGKLAMRAVLGYENDSGWIDSPLANRVNDSELRNFRLKLNARPSENLSIGLSAWTSQNNYGAPSASEDDHRIVGKLAQPISTDYYAYGAKVMYDMLDFVITSSTSYFRYDNSGTLDLTNFGLDGFPFFTAFDSKVISEELVATSAPSKSWQWSGGVFFRDAKDRLFQTIPGALPAPIAYADSSRSYALFGEIGRKFYENKFGWTVGLRQFHDDVISRELIQDQGLIGVPLYRQSASFNATTPRAVLNWYTPSGGLVYVSYSQGYRSGAPQNANIIQAAPEIPPVKPDKLRNYELGGKFDFLDNRIQIDSSIYYIDWHDVQQALSIPFGDHGVVTAQINGESASGVGADFSLTLKPLSGLTLQSYISWNDLSLDSPVFGATSGLPVQIFAKHDRLNSSPEYTAGSTGSYSVPIAKTSLYATLAASANYSSYQTGRSLSGSTLIISRGDSFLVVRSTFAIEPEQNGRWSLTAFVENATNESGGTPSVVPDWTPRIRPRTVGLQFDYRLN